MRTLLIILASLIVGAGGALYADRQPDIRWQIDRVFDRFALPSSDVDLESRGVEAATLADYSLEPCFFRDPSHADEPPGWMQRPALNAAASERTSDRPFPDIEAFPGLVKIEQVLSAGGTQRQHCAATRIAENWFLTANHCVRMRGPTSQVIDMILIAPAHDVMQPETVIVPIEGAVCHSAWYSDTGKFDDDIALVYVEDTEPLSEVEIARTDLGDMPLPISAGDTAYFAGWGKNGQNRFLQGGPLVVRNVGETFIMVDNGGRFAPCVGDSGGPLYVPTTNGPQVVGVLSSVTVDACPPSDRAFYMRVKSFDVWMRRAMSICEQGGRFVCLRPEGEI